MKQLPKINLDDNETGCCPRFHPEDWDEKIFEFDSLLFAKAYTRSFFHIPMNMGSVMKKAMERIEGSNARVEDNYLLLSRDLSPWKTEHLFLVTKDVAEMESVKLSGRFASKVFEGPYKDQPKWMGEMDKYVNRLGEKAVEVYAFYTTCPECAKHYGKNYVVILSKLA